MIVRRKGHVDCPPGTKEYKIVDRSQMSGQKMEATICARNDKEAIEEYNKGSWPLALWKRIR